MDKLIQQTSREINYLCYHKMIIKNAIDKKSGIIKIVIEKIITEERNNVTKIRIKTYIVELSIHRDKFPNLRKYNSFLIGKNLHVFKTNSQITRSIVSR